MPNNRLTETEFRAISRDGYQAVKQFDKELTREWKAVEKRWFGLMDDREVRDYLNALNVQQNNISSIFGEVVLLEEAFIQLKNERAAKKDTPVRDALRIAVGIPTLVLVPLLTKDNEKLADAYGRWFNRIFKPVQSRIHTRVRAEASLYQSEKKKAKYNGDTHPTPRPF